MLSEGKLEELKPCPFCGDDQSSFAGNCEGAFARCSDGTLSVNCDCGVTGPAGADGLAAIRAWNTRAQAPAPVGGELVEACITDIKEGLCCPRIHGCEQNDGEFCLVRQAFARAGLIADPYAALSPDPTEGGGR